MWKLKSPSKELIDWYKNTMLKSLKDRILKSPILPKSVKDILLPIIIPFVDNRDENLLSDLLTLPPTDSYALNKLLMDRIKSLPEYRLYSSFNGKIKTMEQRLTSVFDYEGQISRNKSRAYRIAHEQGRNTCPYCNRSYVITVVKHDTEKPNFPLKINDDNRITRPHLDHWFDKATHPLLSLNIFNLIPCCPVCNSSIKGSEPFSLSTHINPYIYPKDEPPFSFYIAPQSGNKRFPFVVKIGDLFKCDEREINTIRAFALDDVYAYHGMLEAKDLLDWKIDNSAGYLKNLFDTTLVKYKKSTEEVFRMFFGTEYLSENTLDRPLSKLKRDILRQIGLFDTL